MIIAQRFLDEVIAHAVKDAPCECCGMVAVLDGVVQKVYPSVNVSPEPTRSFQVDPVDQAQVTAEITDAGWQLGAVYHSHPKWIAYPSRSDIHMAFRDDVLTMIVGLESAPEVRVFWIRDQIRFEDASLRVVD